MNGWIFPTDGRWTREGGVLEWLQSFRDGAAALANEDVGMVNPRLVDFVTLALDRLWT